MKCLHPYCPNGDGHTSWNEVLDNPDLRLRAAEKSKFAPLLSGATTLGSGAAIVVSAAIMNSQPFKRVLDACPCLFAQLKIKVTPAAVIHLCELTLNSRITSTNACDAFDIQHPNTLSSFRYPPQVHGASGGDIMERLCSEILTNHGIPEAKLSSGGWPEWRNPSHISLNYGKFHALKLYGDILIPCAPHNLLVSVKSEAARERLLVSGNRLESIGFGFFNKPAEFWTESRMNLTKRWGFSAIYMPQSTLTEIERHLADKGTSDYALNINGKPLYRSIENFGADVLNVAGKISIEL